MPNLGIGWFSMNNEPKEPTRYPMRVFLKPFMPRTDPRRESSTSPAPIPMSIAPAGGLVRPKYTTMMRNRSQ